MKTFYCLIFCLISYGLFSQEDTFKKGAAAFQAGEYQEAIASFEKILVSGYESADVYYNLGIANYKSELLGPAILNLERALKLNPHHKEAKQALHEVSEDIEIPVTKIDNFILWSWYRTVLKTFTSNQWAIIQLTFGLGVLFATYFLLFRSGWRKTLIASLVVVSIIAFAGSWYASYQKRILEIGGEAGIVMSDRTFVMKAPDERSEVVTEVSEGTKVFLRDRIGEWIKVQLEDKDTGWIEIKKVEII